MKIELMKKVTLDVVFIQVSAEVRYWEDASVNGEEDKDGTLIPLRNGENWEPIIDLSTGVIKDWPAGTSASIHYKVCDQGEYWLLDKDGTRVAKWTGHYVPDDFLCVGSNGYGDYIILEIDDNGRIEGWDAPCPDDEQWEAV